MVRVSTFRRRIALLVFVVAAGALVVAPSRASSPPAYRLIVNPANPTAVVERRFVAEAFLKKTTRWPDGSLIRPVDLGAESPTRQRFSEDMLGRSLAAVKSYWQQVLFAGRDLPPPELDTDDDVIQYVLRYAGAVGYVSGAASIERVKFVTVK
jgi:ABC-type phosphate transport system substrate-binding protein